MASHEKVESFVDGFWDDEILPSIQEYIRVPNVSPHFQPEWEKNGHMEKALEAGEELGRKAQARRLQAARRPAARPDAAFVAGRS